MGLQKAHKNESLRLLREAIGSSLKFAKARAGRTKRKVFDVSKLEADIMNDGDDGCDDNDGDDDEDA